MGCYNDDILFIHIPKCGGWSVKTYLHEHLPGILMPDNPVSKLPIGHVRLQHIEQFTGRKPSSFARIIAVVRNPYEQQISQACFWATRYLKGDRHPHDVGTWHYVCAAIVNAAVVECALRGRQFTWRPEFLNLTGFVADPACDFHVWYQQHVSPLRHAPKGANRYEHFGGLFRHWITVDDEIPDNLWIVRQENLDEELRAAIAPFANHELPPLERLNTSSWAGDARDWYTSSAIRTVEAKCPWVFDHYYLRLSEMDRYVSPEPELVA